MLSQLDLVLGPARLILCSMVQVVFGVDRALGFYC
jgi:hypothetical protein